MPDLHAVSAPHRPCARGVLLRSILVVVLLDEGRPMRVAELCRRLHQRGFTVQGRASKAVSDALRWEVARGRVRQRGRGLYASGQVATTTRWRMRNRIAAALQGNAPDHHVLPPRPGQAEWPPIRPPPT